MLSGRHRGVAAVLVAVGIAGWVVSPARAQTPSTFTTFSLRATATGAAVLYEVRGLLPIDRFVEISSIFSESYVGPSSATGLAAAPHPGATLLTVGSTFDGFSGVTDMPDYPLAAGAEAPLTPEADASAGPMQLVAHAVPGSSDATARFASSDNGGVRATSETVASDGLRARGTSRSQGLSFADGAVTVGDVESVVELAFRDGTATIVENRTVVSNLRVLGTPVIVGDDGVIIADQPIDLTGAQPAASALEAQGVQVRVVAPTVDHDHTGITVTSGSLVVETAGEVQGSPSTFKVVYGGVVVDLDARPGTAPAALEPSARRQAFGSVGGPDATDQRIAASTVEVGNNGEATPGRPADTDTGTSISGLAPAVSVAEPLDFRPVYPWMAVIGLAALLLQRWAVSASQRQEKASDLRHLWRW